MVGPKSGPRGKNPGYWKNLSHPEGARIVYVRKTQEYDFLSCVHNARKSMKWNGHLPKVPEEMKASKYRLLAFASESCGPDGDALHAFHRSSMPAGLVIRMELPEDSEAQKRRLAHVPHLIIRTTDPAELKRLATFKRRGCSTSQAGRTPKPKPVWYRPPEEEFLIPVAIPADEIMVEAVADAVGEYNSSRGQEAGRDEELAPYLIDTVVPVSAAVSIQSAWRSYCARKQISPPVASRVVVRRAAICLQRWWKLQLFKLRFCHLAVIRRQMLMLQKFSSPEVVMTVGSYRRMASLAKARQEGTAFPMLSPEHKLRFSFDRNNNVVASSSVQKSQRSVPRWTGADVPAVTEGGVNKLYDTCDLKYLLFKGAVMKELGPPPERASKLMATDYIMHLTFSSAEEARRRVALFSALSFDFKTQTQLVTLLPAPVSLDRKNPASVPGMGLTDASLKLGTLKELVQDVIPMTSILWPYIMDMLAPEVVEEQREVTAPPISKLTQVHFDPLMRPIVDTSMKPESRFLDEAPVSPTIEEEVEDREARYGLPPVRLTRRPAQPTRYLGPMRAMSQEGLEPLDIQIPTIPRDMSPPFLRDPELSFDQLIPSPSPPSTMEAAAGILKREALPDGPKMSAPSMSNMYGVTLAPLETRGQSPNIGSLLGSIEAEGSLAESMALTRKLMANLQRVETAENEIAIKLNLRAELALRQEQVSMIMDSKGMGIRKYWKTTVPSSLVEQPTLEESVQARRYIDEIHQTEGRMLIQQMRKEHAEAVRANIDGRNRKMQELSQLALRQQTTVLKEVDRRRLAEEEQNRRKVQFRKVVQQRAQMLRRERKFVQAFQRQHNVLNRQIVNAELRYRDIMTDEHHYERVAVQKKTAVAKKKEVKAGIVESRQRKQEKVKTMHASNAVVIAKNKKKEEDFIKEIVKLRREDIRKGMAMVGPAGGTWGCRRPETYRQTLVMTSVASAAEAERSASALASEEASLAQNLSEGYETSVDYSGHHVDPDTFGGGQAMVKAEKSEAEWAAEIDNLNAFIANGLEDTIDDDDEQVVNSPRLDGASTAIA